MKKSAQKIFARLGQLTAIGAFVALLFLDLATGLIDTSPDREVGPLLGLAEVVSAFGVAATLRYALNRPSLPLAGWAIGVGIYSCFVTVAEAVIDTNTFSWGLAETAALLGLLFLVARRSTTRLTLPACAVVATAVIVQPFSHGTGPDSLALTEQMIFALILALAASGAVVGGGFLRLQESGRRRHVEAVRAEQRTQFARDLHDFIAHHVTGIVVQAQGARVVAGQHSPQLVGALEEIERAGAETMAAMRRMVGFLRAEHEPAATDAPLAPLAGIAELTSLVEGFQMPGGPAPRLYLEGPFDELPVEVTSSAYRIVMEALTNVRRHAAAAGVVDVCVRRTPDWLLVRVVNDGPSSRAGRPGEGRGGFGLVGLTERVSAIGGRIQAGPGIEDGWAVDAALPLSRPSLSGR